MPPKDSHFKIKRYEVPTENRILEFAPEKMHPKILQSVKGYKINQIESIQYHYKIIRLGGNINNE